VIVDLGSATKKKVDRLKKGKGPLMEELESVIDEVMEALPEHVDGKTILPVVAIYRKKSKRSKAGLPLFPFPVFYDDDDDDDDDDD
jgi:hypothetical protein